MSCWECGERLSEEARFCPQCGAPVKVRDERRAEDSGQSDIDNRIHLPSHIHSVSQKDSTGMTDGLKKSFKKIIHFGHRYRSLLIAAATVVAIVVLFGFVIPNAHNLFQPRASDPSVIDGADGIEEYEESQEENAAQYPVVDAIERECTQYSTPQNQIGRTSDLTLINYTFVLKETDGVGDMSIPGCIAQQIGVSDDFTSVLRLHSTLLSMSSRSFTTLNSAVEHIQGIQFTKLSDTAAARCVLVIASSNVISCQIRDVSTVSASIAPSSRTDDSYTENGTESETENSNSDISYPPYPGGISEDEYWRYVEDMTTETEIQSMHTGMWQIADCKPVGISTTGQEPLPGAAGIIVTLAATRVVPDPVNGTMCVTRQGDDSGNIGVSYYDTFVPLTREQIDMEPSAKAQMLSSE